MRRPIFGENSCRVVIVSSCSSFPCSIANSTIWPIGLVSGAKPGTRFLYQIISKLGCVSGSNRVAAS